MKFNKKSGKKRRGVEITWCKFQELKMYFKLCIWCVCILHSCAVKTDLRTAILLRSILSGGAHDIVVCVCVCRGVRALSGVSEVSELSEVSEVSEVSDIDTLDTN